MSASALATTTELLRLLSDPTRVRLLALLGSEELTVAEITGVTQLGQSRVSTHLGKLREADLVRDRRAGSSTYYALNEGGMPDHAARLFRVMLETTHDAVFERDRQRAREVVQGRTQGMSWADAVAGQMEHHYSPGRTWEATARGLLGLARYGDVLDVASGDGALTELVAPRARSVTCLDVSEKVIAAAERRLARLGNVTFVCGDMHRLPFAEASFDAVMLMNCLTYAREPRAVLVEAARVLRPGGTLTGVTLLGHAHERVVAAYGHLRSGFERDELERLIGDSGLRVASCAVTSRESRPPHFEVVTFFADKFFAHREPPR
jgi:ArsR family transcriptional regulator